ncbi:MAG: hypothetical protein RL017_422, partial [Pseudomonadota bacterium]
PKINETTDVYIIVFVFMSASFSQIMGKGIKY